eukprot:scaffold522_cov168-Amphora_coffeaeformis.AAC.13
MEDLAFRVFSFLDFDSYCTTVVVFEPSQQVQDVEKDRRMAEAKAHISNSAALLAGRVKPSTKDMKEAIESRSAAAKLIGRCNTGHWKVDLTHLLSPDLRESIALRLRMPEFILCTVDVSAWLSTVLLRLVRHIRTNSARKATGVP